MTFVPASQIFHHPLNAWREQGVKNNNTANDITDILRSDKSEEKLNTETRKSIIFDLQEGVLTQHNIFRIGFSL